MRSICRSRQEPSPTTTENAQQDTKTLWSLAGFQICGSKRAIFELGGFAYAFAEITDVKSLKPDSGKLGKAIPKPIYMHSRKNQMLFLLFLVFFLF